MNLTSNRIQSCCNFWKIGIICGICCSISKNFLNQHLCLSWSNLINSPFHFVQYIISNTDLIYSYTLNSLFCYLLLKDCEAIFILCVDDMILLILQFFIISYLSQLSHLSYKWEQGSWLTHLIHSFLPPKIRGISCFWNLDKEGGHEKVAQK